MNEKSLAIGSTLAAFLASVCCLGPLVLGGVGLSAALVATFAPLRPYFLALSAVLLAAGFYFAYRKPRRAEEGEAQACAPESRARLLAKPMLWLATLAVAALAFFPSYGGKLVSPPKGTAAAPASRLETVQLKLSGLSCEACAGVIERSLMKMPGVNRANVDYPLSRATVQYDPAQTSREKLLEAVETAGFRAASSDPSLR